MSNFKNKKTATPMDNFGQKIQYEFLGREWDKLLMEGFNLLNFFHCQFDLTANRLWVCSDARKEYIKRVYGYKLEEIFGNSFVIEVEPNPKKRASLCDGERLVYHVNGDTPTARMRAIEDNPSLLYWDIMPRNKPHQQNDKSWFDRIFPHGQPTQGTFYQRRDDGLKILTDYAAQCFGRLLKEGFDLSQRTRDEYQQWKQIKLATKETQ